MLAYRSCASRTSERLPKIASASSNSRTAVDPARLGEDALEVLLGLPDVLVDHRGEVDGVELEAEFAGEDLGRHGLAGAGLAGEQPGDAPAAAAAGPHAPLARARGPDAGRGRRARRPGCAWWRAGRVVPPDGGFDPAGEPLETGSRSGSRAPCAQISQPHRSRSARSAADGPCATCGVRGGTGAAPTRYRGRRRAAGAEGARQSATCSAARPRVGVELQMGSSAQHGSQRRPPQRTNGTGVRTQRRTARWLALDEGVRPARRRARAPSQVASRSSDASQLPGVRVGDEPGGVDESARRPWSTSADAQRGTRSAGPVAKGDRS